MKGEVDMRSFFSFALALGITTVGCGSQDAAWADEAADTMDSLAYEIAFISQATNGMSAAATPEDAASANAGVLGSYWDTACVTPTIDGASVVYIFDECDGPWNLTDVTGTVTITYRNATGTELGFDIATTDLVIGSAAVTFAVAADIATDGRNVTVESSAVLAGRRGTQLSRRGTYNLAWIAAGETGCAGIDAATVSLMVGGEAASASISGFSSCAVGCPRGGSTTYAPTGGSVTLTFDNTDQAAWTSGSGASGSLPIFCQ